jgi:hypothetical protein
VKELGKKRKEIEGRYAQMRKEVFKIKQIKLYKPVKGDEVDEMFADYLNEAKLQIEVERISANNYLFGSKKILAKIINKRLVIRVGGGFMNAQEFIDHYGRIEMLKKLKYEEESNNINNNSNSAGGKPNPLRRGTIAAGQLKNQIRNTLVNIRPYDPNNRSNGSMRNSLKSSNRVTNKLGLDSK